MVRYRNSTVVSVVVHLVLLIAAIDAWNSLDDDVLCASSVQAFKRRLSLQNFGSRPSDRYFRSVCWLVCLFVQSFSQPSLIRFRSNLAVCYMSGSSCVP